MFGPRPHKYVKAMPKKMRRAALRSALSVKVGAGQVVIVDGLSVEQPKTKVMVEMLAALGLSEQSVLLVLAERDFAVQRSANNLPNVKTLMSAYLNVRDLLGHDILLLAKEAVAPVEDWLTADLSLDVRDEAGDPVADEAEE